MSELLGGHALTLDVMARNIVAKTKRVPAATLSGSTRRSPACCHKKPRIKIANQYYKRDEDPESLWELPFGQLEADEAAVLGVLSMYGPNNVPFSALDKGQ